MRFAIEFILIAFSTFVIANVVARSYILSTLKDIERYTRMYGSVKEIESMYIHTILVFTPMDLIRRFVLRKPQIYWRDWHFFLCKKLDVRPRSTTPLDYEKTTHEELAKLLREFREENF